ncbi:serine protease Do [Plasticicumulans lactativorans]|uniref:Probable periplasmic serine endoprotease DegP-like n=1 Tax=Plasticicumulans lactativorans TaxID=1133106 RepID=A0A4R2L768_9GAMM|nr:DegQ family serine endoprotease [Plasticicumulans lactativorans]TCO82413.1 serine protease Do [Plasticicumulans lactativorans]
MNALARWAAATGLAGVALLATAATAADLPDFTELVERYAPAVVSVNAGNRQPAAGKGAPRAETPNPFEGTPFEEPFRRFFEQMPERAPREMPNAIGSGFIVSADGYILTNAHVVEGADTVTVGFSDRRELAAEVVGKDARSDLALLKVKADNLPTVRIGDSDRVKVGQWVVAIGSPFGFEASASLGIVSALGRSLPSESYVPFIQTDAAVNPGNSGGPLFNRDGEVIGINSQIYSRSGGYQGLAFAIPINVAMKVVEQLKASGKVSRGWLGVLIQEVTPDLARSFGLDRPRGALVGQVLPDGPAAKAGLKAGDIVLECEGRVVLRSGDLPPLVGSLSPGRPAALKVFREGKEIVVNVTIEELPDDVARADKPGGFARQGLGLVVGELAAEQFAKGETGVVVRELSPGPATRAGVRPGDVITRINNEAVTGVAQFEELVRKLPKGKPVPILVKRGDAALFLALTLEP